MATATAASIPEWTEDKDVITSKSDALTKSLQAAKESPELQLVAHLQLLGERLVFITGKLK